jgi:lysophospholipase L1-like esterase
MRHPNTVRRRLLILAALAMAVALVAAAGAGASAVGKGHGKQHKKKPVKHTYLALGDSVAFGYVPPNASPAPNYLDATTFSGYPEYLAKTLKETVANASCPGETSGSMLVAGAPSNGCENQPGSLVGYRTVYPLHVQYSGTQMQYAISYLKTHPYTNLVTLDIGANDAFLCQETTADKCASSTELGDVASALTTNLGTIFNDLRKTAHYHGKIVVLTYYALTYADQTQVAQAQFLDSTLTTAAQADGGIVADGFGAFQTASASSGGDPCAAGLLIKLPDGTCNIHPSPAGHQVLAAAIDKVLKG